MTKQNRRVLVVFTFLMLLLFATVVFAGPIFTGDAPADFITPDTIVVPDPGGIGDVGVPGSAPLGTISGWDAAASYLDYDPDTDTMFVGVDCGGVSASPRIICGDADGDGDPDVTSPWLAALFGTDNANWALSESFALLLDTDLDGNADVNIGVNDSNDFSTFGAYTRILVGGFGSPSLSLLWGPQLPNTVTVFTTPNATAHDLEFTIADFSTLPGFTFVPGESFDVSLMFFQGSQDDGGIGEDFWPTNSGTTVTFPDVAFDWGDIPDPPSPITLETNDGARHIIGGPYLGNCVDDEPDGQPSLPVTGDDIGAQATVTIGTCDTPNDDEDGVTRISSVGDNLGHGGWTEGDVVDGDGGGLEIVITNGPAVPQVFLFGPAGGGGEVTLFESDGITEIGSLPTGTHQVYFNLPPDTFLNAISIFGRVRLSTAGELGAVGGAPDGEVEDYIWNFGPTAVNLVAFNASSNPELIWLAALAVLGLLLGSALVVKNRRS